MMKSLITLVLLGALCNFASAQSSVTIYGLMDTGVMKETGRDAQMTEAYRNHIGFKGTENINSHLKATFQLEKSFSTNNGKEYMTGVGNINTPGWDGQANVGLKSDWGYIRLGRIWEMRYESMFAVDPFSQGGVGSLVFSSQRVPRFGDTIRYDSPVMKGFSLGASYTLGKNTRNNDALVIPGVGDISNNGFGLQVKQVYGPLMVMGNFTRMADSDNSSLLNIAGAYKLNDSVRMTFAYEQSRDKAGYVLGVKSGAIGTADPGTPNKQNNALLGLIWKTGPNTFRASLQYVKVKDVAAWNDECKDLKKYAIGYDYHFSKRTWLYANLAYTKYDDEKLGSFFGARNEDSVIGYQIGLAHLF